MAYSIALDIGGTNTRIAILDENHLIKIRESIKTKNSVDFSGVIGHEINNILEKNKISKSNIVAIGAGIPSITENGIIYDTTNIRSWKEVRLKEELERITGIATFVENDAKCFALGELITGKLKGSKNAVAIILGTGVGSGIIINGDIYAGMMSSAGEIGKNILFDGTVEDYCSGKFFKKKGYTGEEIFDEAEQKNKIALKILSEYGTNLGLALVDVINIISPERIVFGGSIARCYPYFSKSMNLTIKRKMHFKRLFEKIEFLTTDSMDSALIGAASVPKIRSV